MIIYSAGSQARLTIQDNQNRKKARLILSLINLLSIFHKFHIIMPFLKSL